MSWFYYFGRIGTKVLLRLFTKWRVNGIENIPRQGRLLVVANHLNATDPPVLGASISRKTVFMAKEELFRSPLSRYFVTNYGAFPVHRGRLDRNAIRQAEQVLADGAALVMFPEATRSKTHQLQDAYPGSALIAFHTGATILPVGISGTEKIRGINWMFRRPQVTVNIGKPFQLPKVNGKLSRGELNEFTEMLMRNIAQLLSREYRGKYASKETE